MNIQPDIGTDTGYPDKKEAGYPANSVSGATLIFSLQILISTFRDPTHNFFLKREREKRREWKYLLQFLKGEFFACFILIQLVNLKPRGDQGVLPVSPPSPLCTSQIIYDSIPGRIRDVLHGLGHKGHVHAH